MFCHLGHLFFFCLLVCFCLGAPGTYKGGALGVHSDAVHGGGAEREQWPPATLSASFQSLPLLPTIKLGPSGAGS